MLPGMGSDTEGVVYHDGGAISDNGGFANRLKLNPPAQISGNLPISRSGSGTAPPRQPQNRPQVTTQGAFPEAQEIIEAIPTGGMLMKDLLAQFRPRVGDRQSDFIKLMQTVARMDKGTKLLFPKTVRSHPPETNGNVEVKQDGS